MLSKRKNSLFLQERQQDLVEAVRVRKLGSVTQLGELVQLAVLQLLGNLGTKNVKVAELSGNGGRRPLSSNGSLVLVADDEKRTGLDVTEVVGDGRGENHVDDLSLVLHICVALGAVVDVDKHVDPGVVGGLPLSDVVDLLLVTLDRLVGGGGLGDDGLVDADVGNALLNIVLQTDRVDHDHLLNGLGVLETKASSHHSAHGMANDGDVSNTSGIEQTTRVPGKLVKAELVRIGLGTLAETNLIGSNDAVASGGQHADGILPSRATEVLAMEHHSRLAVSLASRLDVHEGHLEVLTLALELEQLDRPRVGEVGTIELLRERAIINGACSLSSS